MTAQADGQGKNNKSLILVFGIVVIALLIVIVVLLIKGMNKPEEKVEPNKREVLITEDNADQVVADILEETEEERTAPTSYETVMNTIWHFPDGASESSDAYVENAKENTTDMYFDVKLADTEEKVFESPIIPLGEHIEKFKLSKDLDAGTYDCVLTYNLVDEEQKVLGSLDVAVTIIVEK